MMSKSCSGVLNVAGLCGLSRPSDLTMDNSVGPTIVHQSDFLEMASMDGFTNGLLTRFLFVMIVGIVVVVVVVVIVVVVSSSSLFASGLTGSFWLAQLLAVCCCCCCCCCCCIVDSALLS